MAPAEPKPVISQQSALLCELLFTLFYVAPFYLSATLRSTPFNSRDAPTVIRARVRAVGLTCLACTVVTVYVLTIQGNATPQEVLRQLGIWPVNPFDSVRVLGLVMVLFTCSLYESIVVNSEWRCWSMSSLKEATFDSWTGYREPDRGAGQRRGRLPITYHPTIFNGERQLKTNHLHYTTRLWPCASSPPGRVPSG